MSYRASFRASYCSILPQHPRKTYIGITYVYREQHRRDRVSISCKPYCVCFSMLPRCTLRYSAVSAHSCSCHLLTWQWSWEWEYKQCPMAASTSHINVNLRAASFPPLLSRSPSQSSIPSLPLYQVLCSTYLELTEAKCCLWPCCDR